MIDLAIAAAGSSLIQLANIKEAEERWTGAITLNASAATGNTDNTVLGGNFSTARKFGAITHLIEAGGNYTETTREENGSEITDVTQNRWFVQYRMEWGFNEKTFAYGRTRYSEDQFSGFDRTAFAGGGIGHTFVETKTRRFQVLGGPGVQYFARTRPQPLPDDFEDSQTVLALFVGETFRQVIRENVTFEQSFDGTFSDENITIDNTISLKTDLTEKISSRISYQVIHNTEPPEGREQTDTLLTASLGYEF